MGCLSRGTWGQRRLLFLVVEDKKDVSMLKPGRKGPREREWLGDARSRAGAAGWRVRGPGCRLWGSSGQGGPHLSLVTGLKEKRVGHLPRGLGAPSRVERVLGFQTGLLLERGDWRVDGGVAGCQAVLRQVSRRGPEAILVYFGEATHGDFI